jgi:hypothetical protein
MRKLVRMPDGTTSMIEGTPDEIRQYERIVEGERPKLPTAGPTGEMPPRPGVGILRGEGYPGNVPLPDFRQLYQEPFYPVTDDPSTFPLLVGRNSDRFLTCLQCQRTACQCHDSVLRLTVNPMYHWAS